MGLSSAKFTRSPRTESMVDTTKHFKIKTYNKAALEDDGKTLKNSSSSSRPIPFRGASMNPDIKEQSEALPKLENKSQLIKNVVGIFD